MNNIKRALTEYLEYFKFIFKDKQRALQFIILSAIFIITPVQNYYAKLDIKPDRPVLREINVDLPEIGILPVNTANTPAPSLTAQSVVIIDVLSKTLIYGKNPDLKILPASTTKIMTALVVLDNWQLDDVLEVKKVNGIGQSMKLNLGEEITVENLLYGLLVQSGNDAAYALADNFPGEKGEFVKQMNKKAQDLQLNDTNFTNPAGIEEEGHITTSHDLAVLSSEAIKNQTLLKIASTPKIVVTDITGQVVHDLKNINELVGKVEGIKGLKTGWTENAGECLISFIERDGKQVLFVVMNSQDRFGETSKIIDWVFASFSWQAIESTQK